MRWAVCAWCGRSREDVRYDDLPAECQSRPEIPEIVDVIRGEEKKAFALIDKAKRIVPKVVGKLGMSGETLAVLHHTHGYDPEIVATLTDVPSQMLAEYNASMETEKARSRAARKVTVVGVAPPADAPQPPDLPESCPQE